MPRILVVEDNRAIADLVGLYLRHDGHDVTAVASGLDALALFESDPAEFDLVVLDLMLPGLDGRGVCRRIRDRSNIPILMLTALDDDRDKLHGFDLGADDYLTKPFNPNELVARVRAILRRSIAAGPDPNKPSPKVGNIDLVLERRTLFVAGSEVPLRTKEFDLLAAFAEHTGIVLTRERLLERVWASELDGDTRTVDVHISRLREKLASAGASISIETVRSVGYRLREHP